MTEKGSGGKTRGLYKQPKSPYWWIRYKDSEGRYCRKSTGQTSKKAALEYLSKRRIEASDEKFLGRKPATRMNLRELLYERYLPWAESAKATSSYRRDTFSAKRLCEYLGEKRVRDLSFEQVESYRQQRIDAGATPATCNREIALLRHCINKAIQWGLLFGDNPVAKLRAFKEKSRVRLLTQDEQTHLLRACKQSRQRSLLPFVKLALVTGLRLGELHALQWQDLDLPRGTLTVRDGKGGKSRVVPLNTEAVDTLNAVERKSDHVFPARSYKHSFMTALRRADLNDFRFHDLRRTFATNLLAQGADLITVRDILGHAQIPQTLIYLASSRDRLKRAVDRLPSLTLQDDAVECETEVGRKIAY